jgi:hypothetical protein
MKLYIVLASTVWTEHTNNNVVVMSDYYAATINYQGTGSNLTEGHNSLLYFYLYWRLVHYTLYYLRALLISRDFAVSCWWVLVLNW